MSTAVIKALVRQELYITRNSLEIFFDIFFYPLMNVVLFGLITHFVAGIKEATSAEYLILGVLLWDIITINQYGVTVSSMWNVWAHNLTNIFIAPISAREYLFSHILAAAIKTTLVFLILSGFTYLFFDFNIFKLGLVNLILFSINLSLFAWWVGIILLGFIFRYGVRIQAISWGLIFLFQPLTASFFPLSVLPEGLRLIANILPPTYVFESARQALTTSGIYWRPSIIALVLNVIYFAAAAWAFSKLFHKSKVSGQFARNDL